MTNIAKNSISAAALAAAMLMGGAAFAQGAGGAPGSVDAATNANAAEMAKQPTTKPAKPMAAPATGMNNATTTGSMPATGGSTGAMAPKTPGAAGAMNNAKSPGSVQPTDGMAATPKPKMTAQERADRKAARQAEKMSKSAPAKDAMLNSSTGMPAKP